MYGFVYLTTCLKNGKKYIGMCSHESINEGKYLGSGTILKNAIKRYGRDNFERITLQECKTKEDLELAEKQWIAKYDAVNNPLFYNLAEGGAGGSSKAMKAIWNNRSLRERKKIGNKISATRKELRLAVGENNPMYGKSIRFQKESPYGKIDISRSEFVKNIWDTRSENERKLIGNKVSQTRKELGLASGKNNPMYGRSAVTEKNLKWYTNGNENKYITEGTQPAGFVRGRTNLSGNIGKRK